MVYILWLTLVVSILVLICKNLSFSKLETVLTTIFFFLSPFRLERFGSIEPFHFWILAVGVYIFIYLQVKNRFLHLTQTLIFIGLSLLWISGSGSLSKDYSVISSNTIQLFSLEFIFFRNTTFLQSNALGVFFPESLLLFLIGLFQSLTNSKYYSLLIALSLSMIVSIFISDPLFVIAPISWFSVLAGLGIKKLIQLYSKENKGIKFAILFYSFIFLFGEIQSIHYILVHYAFTFNGM